LMPSVDTSHHAPPHKEFVGLAGHARAYPTLPSSLQPKRFNHSTTILASTTGPHVSRLWWIKSRISSGVLASGSASRVRRRERNSPSWNPCASARDTFVEISLGVPGGAATAIQVSA